MSATLANSIQALDVVLMETGLLMHQVTQGSVKSATAIERVCALVAADVQQRILEIARHSPSASAVRGLQARRATLGAFEFNLRRSAHEMNATLSQFLPTEAASSSGTYSPEKIRVASAGAWMNVRSSP
jgi:hypothetical protein